MAEVPDWQKTTPSIPRVLATRVDDVDPFRDVSHLSIHEGNCTSLNFPSSSGFTAFAKSKALAIEGRGSKWFVPREQASPEETSPAAALAVTQPIALLAAEPRDPVHMPEAFCDLKRKADMIAFPKVQAAPTEMMGPTRSEQQAAVYLYPRLDPKAKAATMVSQNIKMGTTQAMDPTRSVDRTQTFFDLIEPVSVVDKGTQAIVSEARDLEISKPEAQPIDLTVAESVDLTVVVSLPAVAQTTNTVSTESITALAKSMPRRRAPPTVSASGTTDILQPQVHVLLAPGCTTAPRPLIKDMKSWTICVMGLYNSGTHALREYVCRYFDARVEPQNKRSDDGTVELRNGFRIWKHTVPLGPFAAPDVGKEGGRAVVLLTIREVRSWLCSLSRRPYELYPHPRRKRRLNDVSWMLDEVTFATSECYNNPFRDRHFPSVVDLWIDYAAGYLFGHMANAEGPLYLIVRYEDIVVRPADIVGALAEMGLPRNEVPFATIEHSLWGQMDRSTLIERVRRSCLRSHVFLPLTAFPEALHTINNSLIKDSFNKNDRLLPRLLSLLSSPQSKHLLALLGYGVPEECVRAVGDKARLDRTSPPPSKRLRFSLNVPSDRPESSLAVVEACSPHTSKLHAATVAVQPRGDDMAQQILSLAAPSVEGHDVAQQVPLSAVSKHEYRPSSREGTALGLPEEMCDRCELVYPSSSLDASKSPAKSTTVPSAPSSSSQLSGRSAEDCSSSNCFAISLYGAVVGLSNQRLFLVPLDKPLTLGRSKGCDVTLPSIPRFSKRHISVFQDQMKRRLFVEDLSLNGTWLNTHKLTHRKATEVFPSDRINFFKPGDLEIGFDVVHLTTHQQTNMHMEGSAL